MQGPSAPGQSEAEAGRIPPRLAPPGVRNPCAGREHLRELAAMPYHGLGPPNEGGQDGQAIRRVLKRGFLDP